MNRLSYLLLAAAALAAQQPKNFLQKVLGTGDANTQPMLSADAPAFTLNIAAQELVNEGGVLAVPGSPVRLQLRHEKRDGIDLYRIRHAPGSVIQGEQIRLHFVFRDEVNESMTLDTGAWQGQPLHLPTGKVPDNQFTNWGSLFYDRPANLAVGTWLEGAEASRHARRGYSRFTRTTTLQLVTTTGNPAMEITLFAYRPKDARFWWAEWYQHRAAHLPPNLFPVLAPRDPGWKPGERQTVSILPSPAHRGRKMELAIIDDIRQTLTARVRFEAAVPATHVEVPVGDWRSGLYRLIVVPAGEAIDPAHLDWNRKMANVFVRPASPQSRVLFVAPTDMWWAYSTNGGHDFHGWRTGYDDSAGYSPTVMSSRQRRYNNYFYSLYERYSDIHHYRYLDSLKELPVDWATQYDVALGRVRLDDYELVLVGNHSEFTTVESHRRFAEYLGRGGAVVIHGGDSFAVKVEILPSLEDPRYIWQRGHIWTHLSDQPGNFRAPSVLPPSAGDALDYLNVFHSTVGYWIPGAKAIIEDADHPVTKALNLRRGDEVPGPWGGEVDFAYEPEAWNVLVRSDRAEPESREFGIDAYDPTPLHRVGMAIHKNLRLAMVCGENFPNVLANPGSSRYRELYRQILLHLLEGSRKTGDPGWRALPLEQPVEIDAVRYTLPVAVDYTNPEWHLRGAPYAHYTVEVSADGNRWTAAAERSHGAWRGEQTDFIAPVRARLVRLRGTVSNGRPLEATGIQVRARQ